MQIAVGYEDQTLYADALKLAERLALPLDNQAANLLLLTAHSLRLKISPFKALEANFSVEFWNKRRQEGKKQGIVKACQPKPGKRILDATAGWGRDAAILAVFGASVLMLERNPVIHALLEDALTRQDTASRLALQLQLEKANAMDYLYSLAEADYPHLIYIDPMHPSRQKSALVKKDLQILQQINGPDSDVLALIELAKTRAKEKVVVKWPPSLAPLIKPDFSFAGKTVRFDVYTSLA